MSRAKNQHGRRWRLVSQALVILVLLGRGMVRAGPARAAPPDLPTDPVLGQLIAQSLAARPEVAQSQASARAERERIPQEGALPDPVLQLGVQNDGFTSWEVGSMETSWYSVMVSQTFPWPGKLGLRAEAAELAARGADQNVVRARLSTEAEVRRSYLNLVLARDRLSLLDRLEAISQKSAKLAQIRYEGGQAAQSDVLRAQLEINRIQQRRWGLQAEIDTEVQTLNRLRRHPLDEAIPTSAHLASLSLPVLRDEAEAAQDALARSPELAAAHVTVTEADRRVVLAKKSYFPDLTVNAGVMPRGGPFPPMWLLSVSGPVPIFSESKQSRAVTEGEARVEAGEQGVAALKDTLRLRAAQRRTALAATLETIRLYREGLLVQSQATAESTLSQYEVGKVTFASVLEANVGLITDEDGYLQALAQAQRLEIDAAEVSLSPVAGAGAAGMAAAVPGTGAQGDGAPARSPTAAGVGGGARSGSSAMTGM